MTWNRLFFLPAQWEQILRYSLHRRPEHRHNSVTDKPVDRTIIVMNFVNQDFVDRVHDGMAVHFRMYEEYLIAEQYALMRGRLADFESHSIPL